MVVSAFSHVSLLVYGNDHPNFQFFGALLEPQAT